MILEFDVMTSEANRSGPAWIGKLDRPKPLKPRILLEESEKS